MRRENRKPIAREWEQITSRRPVVRRIPKPEADEEKLERVAGEPLIAFHEAQAEKLRARRGA